MTFKSISFAPDILIKKYPSVQLELQYLFWQRSPSKSFDLKIDFDNFYSCDDYVDARLPLLYFIYLLKLYLSTSG